MSAPSRNSSSVGLHWVLAQSVPGATPSEAAQRIVNLLTRLGVSQPAHVAWSSTQIYLGYRTEAESRSVLDYSQRISVAPEASALRVHEQRDTTPGNRGFIHFSQSSEDQVPRNEPQAASYTIDVYGYGWNLERFGTLVAQSQQQLPYLIVPLVDNQTYRLYFTNRQDATSFAQWYTTVRPIVYVPVAWKAVYYSP